MSVILPMRNEIDRPTFLQMAMRESDQIPDPPVRFSRRQNEIVGLIAAGYSDKQIAEALNVSARTVRTHLERLFAAHGLHNRAQAVLIWAVSGDSTKPD